MIIRSDKKKHILKECSSRRHIRRYNVLNGLHSFHSQWDAVLQYQEYELARLPCYRIGIDERLMNPVLLFFRFWKISKGDDGHIMDKQKKGGVGVLG